MSTTGQAPSNQADPEQNVTPSGYKTPEAGTTSPVAPTDDPPPEADFA